MTEFRGYVVLNDMFRPEIICDAKIAFGVEMKLFDIASLHKKPPKQIRNSVVGALNRHATSVF